MSDHIEELEDVVSDLQSDLQAARNTLSNAEAALENYEPDPDDSDTEEAYEQMLDEVHGDFLGMSASRILKECDPTSYRVGMSDWLDSCDKENFQGYKDLEEARDTAQEEVDDLERQLDDAETELAKAREEEANES